MRVSKPTCRSEFFTGAATLAQRVYNSSSTEWRERMVTALGQLKNEGKSSERAPKESRQAGWKTGLR